MMQRSVLDRYVHRTSPIHVLDPRVKLVATIGFILSNLLLPEDAWPAYLLTWGLILLIGYRSSLGMAFAVKRSFIAVPFMLAGFSVIFAVPGEPLARWQLGGMNLTVTDGGVVRFIAIMARTWLSVQMAILLTATTAFPDLTHALRHLRVPAVLVAIISFMYRYLFVLVDEAHRLLRARAARSAALPGLKAGRSVAWRAKITGSMAGQLFVRSLDRADRVHRSMVARGYHGQLLTMNRHAMRSHDWQAAGLFTASLIAIHLVALALG